MVISFREVYLFLQCYVRPYDMEDRIIRKLIEDKVVIFIAERYGKAPENLIREFLNEDSAALQTLLDNEIAILRGLIKEIEQTV